MCQKVKPEEEMKISGSKYDKGLNWDYKSIEE